MELTRCAKLIRRDSERALFVVSDIVFNDKNSIHCPASYIMQYRENVRYGNRVFSKTSNIYFTNISKRRYIAANQLKGYMLLKNEKS